MASIHELVSTWGDMSVSAWAGHRYGWIMADGQPITVVPWQRAVLDTYEARRPDVSTLFISCPKKAGKTLLDSLILCHRWLTLPGLHFAVGNDKDQSTELQTTMISDMCERHPILKRHVTVNRTELTFNPTGSRIVALPMDFRGASGANFHTVSITELWAFQYEHAQRLYEELTPVPGDCLRIIDSYAGFTGEGSTLQAVWDRGLSGDPVSDDWPIFQSGRQLSYIHTGEDAQRRCWRGSEGERISYYDEQRATLRPGSYRRLHLNEWASAEDAFILPAQWDSLVDPDYILPGSDRSIRLVLGLDASTKHDKTACVSVFKRDDRLHLGPFRIFEPPTDFTAVESYIRELAARYTVDRVAYDPYQLEFLAQRLGRSYIRTVEFPQSVPKLTEAGNLFFDVIKERRLVVYSGCDDLRSHVLSASAKETPRGIRLVKSGTAKIDAAIALSMAIAECDMAPTGILFQVLDIPGW